MKHIKLFQTDSEFKTKLDKLSMPFVVYSNDTKELHYSCDLVPVLYMTDTEGDYYDEVDYEQWYQYVGTQEIEGTKYYKWQRVQYHYGFKKYYCVDIYALTRYPFEFYNSDADLQHPIAADGCIYIDEFVEDYLGSNQIVATGYKEYVKDFASLNDSIMQNEE